MNKLYEEVKGDGTRREDFNAEQLAVIDRFNASLAREAFEPILEALRNHPAEMQAELTRIRPTLQWLTRMAHQPSPDSEPRG